jgi:hypothetical protein
MIVGPIRGPASLKHPRVAYPSRPSADSEDSMMCPIPQRLRCPTTTAHTARFGSPPADRGPHVAGERAPSHRGSAPRARASRSDATLLRLLTGLTQCRAPRAGPGPGHGSASRAVGVLRQELGLSLLPWLPPRKMPAAAQFRAGRRAQPGIRNSRIKFLLGDPVQARLGRSRRRG